MISPDPTKYRLASLRATRRRCGSNLIGRLMAGNLEGAECQLGPWLEDLHRTPWPRKADASSFSRA